MHEIYKIANLLSEDIHVNNGFIFEDEYGIPTGPGKYRITFNRGTVMLCDNIEKGPLQGDATYYVGIGPIGRFVHYGTHRWNKLPLTFKTAMIPPGQFRQEERHSSMSYRYHYFVPYYKILTFNARNIHNVEKLA